jgi:ubiquinone/menaquinone biosynthesis C-methylase UbiE
LYSPFNLAHLFIIQQRQRTTLQLLQRQGISSLAGRRILELGCGRGGVLLEYLGYDANAASLVGIDLLPDRLLDGRTRLPGLSFTCADGQRLPFSSGQFDLVLQYTAFSSILDPQVRASMAAEILRVLQKPDGLIVWYDFWLNPRNPQTKGIRLAEIHRLFPTCVIDWRRITLAPPLVRRLVNVSWTLCSLLETAKIFNSHYLAVIRPFSENDTQ